MKATQIDIRDYPGNIEVFARFGNPEEGNENNGRVLHIECDASMIPSASYIPTQRQIWEDTNRLITLDQAREVKNAIRSHCHWF